MTVDGTVGDWKIEWNPPRNSSAVVEARKNGSKVALLETDIEDRVVYSEEEPFLEEVKGEYADTRQEAYRLVGEFIHDLDYRGRF